MLANVGWLVFLLVVGLGKAYVLWGGRVRRAHEQVKDDEPDRHDRQHRHN